MRVRVDDSSFDPGTELSAFTKDAAGAGAVVSFTGLVRDDTGDLDALEIEHYPAMTTRAIETIAAEAQARWNLCALGIIHRHGRILPGQPIMMVATAARHRADAFAAAEFLMDYLKSRAPFWKKEITRNGAAWVDARTVDEDALKRW